MRSILWVILVTLIIACRSTVPQSVPDWTVHINHSGPIRIGMTLPEVRRALGDAQAFLEGNDPEVPLEDCAYLNSRVVPEELGFMFSQGRVVRIEVFDPGIATDSGFAVGSSESDIRKSLRGRLVIEQHHYVPEGHYLIFTPSTRRRLRFVFETDGSHVTAFRAGTVNAVALVEGCS